MGGQYKFDEIRKSLLSYQSSAASEVVPRFARRKLFRGFAMVIDVEASTCVVETFVEIITEPHRSSRLRSKPVRFQDEVLLL